jgi:hypothetical protein
MTKVGVAGESHDCGGSLGIGWILHFAALRSE